MDEITTTFNTMAAVQSNNIIISLLLAAFVPVACRWVYRFFNETWPMCVRTFLLRYLLNRQVAAAQMQRKCADRSFERLIDNELLIEMILHYIGHLCACSAAFESAHATETDDEKDDFFFSTLKPSAIRHASFRYTTVPRAVDRRSASSDMSPWTSSFNRSKVSVSGLVRLLETEYRLFTVPSLDAPLEVEPGLLVRCVSGTANKGRGAATQAKNHAFDNHVFSDLLEQMDILDATKVHAGEGAIDDSDEESVHEESPIGRQIVFQCRELRPGEVIRLLNDWRHRRSGHAEAEPSVDPTDRIEAFVRRAREWYVQQSSGESKDHLFLFYPSCSEVEAEVLEKRKDDGEDVDPEGCVDEFVVGNRLSVRRYPLLTHGGKSFDTLFFPKKNRVVELIEDFMEKKGKFGVPGITDKLTILLYGPSGTGKTSLVKAMAHKMRRHIVALPFANIETNTTLRHWMSETTVRCVGEEVMHTVYEELSEDESEPFASVWKNQKKVVLKPSEVIYLLEDVDAMGMKGLLQATEEEPRPKVKSGATSPRSDSHAATESQVEETDAFNNMERFLGELRAWLNADRLNVEGVLRALDGIATSSGQVVVMTTNHQDRMDPRLLRPGVITFQLRMGDVDSTTAIEMIQHYFSEKLTEQHVSRMQQLMHSPSDGAPSSKYFINPSRLEQLCVECETIDAVIECLERNAFADLSDVF